MDEATWAWSWLRRHERAFNARAVADMVRDYRRDATLEVHFENAVVCFTGHTDIAAAMTAATAAGCRTTVARLVADTDTVAAQILDEHGRTVMVSFWELHDGQIVRDVSIVLAPGALGLAASADR